MSTRPRSGEDAADTNAAPDDAPVSSRPPHDMRGPETGEDVADGATATRVTPPETLDRPRSTAPAGRSTTTGRLPANAPQAVAAIAAVLAIAVIVLTDIGAVVAVLGVAVLAGVVLYAWSRAVEGRRQATDRVVTYGVNAAFFVAIAPLVSVLYTVVSRGLERFDGQFFSESARNVVGAGGGASHAIVGTLVITLVATAASVPIGVMAAIYLQEYGHGKLKRWLTFFVDVMTGIPSIVAGLFAFALFSLILGPGIRLGIMGSVALSVLMIPIVVRSTEEMLKIVPQSLREASYALGVPKWRTILKVVLPTGLAGIVTGVMVAVARIIGETAPLLITTGTFSTVNWNPFSGRMENLPVFSYDQYKNPGAVAAPYLDRAWAAALTLITIVMVLNLIARFIYRRFGTEIR